MRGAAADSSNRPYATNQVFDDISESFTGVGKTFTLKSDGSNAVGFSTNNACILINGIFQGPTGGLSTYSDYILSQGSGITTITFTGTATSLASDPNNSNIPVGGVVCFCWFYRWIRISTTYRGWWNRNCFYCWNSFLY